MEYPSLDKPKAGAFRFNTDSSQLEIYDGNQWTGVLATSPEQQTGGTRGVLAGGYSPSDWVNTIDYITIATLGNAVDFGDNTDARRGLGGCSSPTRGVFSNKVYTNVMDYLEIATTGNAIDFGDSTDTRGFGGNCSNAHGGL